MSTQTDKTFFHDLFFFFNLLHFPLLKKKNLLRAAAKADKGVKIIN